MATDSPELHTTFVTERYAVLIKAVDTPPDSPAPEAIQPELSIPETFFIFISRAKFWARHNIDMAGAIVSAAFDAATGAMPVGSIRNWFASAPGIDQETLRKRYIDGTLDYLPFEWNPNYLGSSNPLMMAMTDAYRVEYDAEIARRLFTRTAPSRLSAIYAFADRSDCERASKEWGWDLESVREFRLDPHTLNRAIRVNMEIVSLMRGAYEQGGMWGRDDLERIWRSYWGGADKIAIEMALDGRNFQGFESSCIWEWLIEGKLVVV
jgi:hypothetical protein